MKIFRVVLYIIIGIPVLLILFWLIAVPNDLIQERIENAVEHSGGNNMSLSVEGLGKGIFFTLHADSLDLKVEDKPAVKITDFTGSYSPRYLSGGQLGFVIKGKMGTGDVHGIVKLPLEGTIQIDRAELNAIPYLTQFGIDINGSITSDIHIINDDVKVVFEVPDLNIDDSASVIPLLNTFNRLQGALSVKGNTIHVDSISLEGDKGYARLKGIITNNVMHLDLELMPDEDKLNTMESMLIGKYTVSPGYYVVPIKGPLP
jgi:type II secretion system protein N